MITLRIKESITIFQLAILLVGFFLIMGLFYIERSISYHFASSILTLNSILPSKNDNKDSFADEKGNVVPSTYYGMSSFPLEMLVTVIFEEQDGKTKMTLNHSDISGISPTDRSNMEQGWNQSLDKLTEVLVK